jgi:hypothetical protein
MRISPAHALLTGAVVLMLLAPPAAHAELVHGFGSFNNGGFDFSAQEYVTDIDGPFDVWLIDIFDPPIGWVLGGYTDNSIRYHSGVELDDITEAPEDPASYTLFLGVWTDGVYIIRTLDGLYAKLRMTAWAPWGPADFEYYVQMDGSTDLDSSIAVVPTTWGSIKALYSGGEDSR